MPDYGSMLKADLEAEADKRGVDRSDGPLKDELVRRLEQYDADAATDDQVTTDIQTTTDVQVTSTRSPVDQSTVEQPAEIPQPVSTPPEVEVAAPYAAPEGAFDEKFGEGGIAHGHAPYPNDEDLANRLVNANSADLTPNLPPQYQGFDDA